MTTMTSLAKLSERIQPECSSYLVEEILQVERTVSARLLAARDCEAVEHDDSDCVQREDEEDGVEQEEQDADDATGCRQVAEVEVTKWNTQQRVAVHSSDIRARRNSADRL